MTVSATLGGVLLKGTAAARPAANAVSGGTVYSATDTGAITQSDGSSWSTFATISSGLADPMTTRGDLIARNASNVTSRLGVGAAGQVLSSDGTDVSWGNGPLTTQDDIIVGGASGLLTRLAKGTDGQVLTVDPTTHHLVWATPSGGGGGGVSHSYVGYNTIGGSTENLVSSRVYMKKITLAANGFLASIGAYLQERDNGDHLGDVAMALFADNAGSPRELLATSTLSQIQLGLFSANGVQGGARWFHKPIGVWCTAGDYWIAIGFETAASGLRITYDGSGSDRYYTSGGFWIVDSGLYAVTTSANKYSIRASILT